MTRSDRCFSTKFGSAKAKSQQNQQTSEKHQTNIEQAAISVQHEIRMSKHIVRRSSDSSRRRTRMALVAWAPTTSLVEPGVSTSENLWKFPLEYCRYYTFCTGLQVELSSNLFSFVHTKVWIGENFSHGSSTEQP